MEWQARVWKHRQLPQDQSQGGGMEDVPRGLDRPAEAASSSLAKGRSPTRSVWGTPKAARDHWAWHSQEQGPSF